MSRAHIRREEMPICLKRSSTSTVGRTPSADKCHVGAIIFLHGFTNPFSSGLVIGITFPLSTAVVSFGRRLSVGRLRPERFRPVVGM